VIRSTAPGAAALAVAALAAGPLPAQQDTALADLALRLNVAATRLDVLRPGSPARSYSVAVGRPDFPTPLGSYHISTVEWNPWWVPPPSEWARNEVPTPPGPANPMGRVKLYFRTFYFLHGTPDSASIGQAASHGCVRLRNADAIELARAVLAAGAPAMDSARIEALIGDDSATTVLPLERRVPLQMVYQTAELAGDSLVLHPDRYRLAAPTELDVVLDLLESAGLRLTASDVDAVRRRLAEPRPTRRAIPLAELGRATR
jgi:murein L,D-transpeptidase YcbB/YkuD